MAMNALLSLIDRATLGENEAVKLLENIAGDELDRQEAQIDQQLKSLLPLALLVQVCLLAKKRLPYLPLPPALSVLEGEYLYQIGRHYGRVFAHLDQFSVNEETSEAYRSPHSYSRQEIFDVMDCIIRVKDVQAHVLVPLSYRVGVVIGWLSSLSISQKEDVQAALPILVALVQPFLPSSRKQTAQPGRVKMIGKPKKGGKRGAR